MNELNTAIATLDAAITNVNLGKKQKIAAGRLNQLRTNRTQALDDLLKKSPFLAKLIESHIRNIDTENEVVDYAKIQKDLLFFSSLEISDEELLKLNSNADEMYKEFAAVLEVENKYLGSRKSTNKGTWKKFYEKNFTENPNEGLNEAVKESLRTPTPKRWAIKTFITRKSDLVRNAIKKQFMGTLRAKETVEKLKLFDGDLGELSKQVEALNAIEDEEALSEALEQLKQNKYLTDGYEPRSEEEFNTIKLFRNSFKSYVEKLEQKLNNALELAKIQDEGGHSKYYLDKFKAKYEEKNQNLDLEGAKENFKQELEGFLLASSECDSKKSELEALEAEFKKLQLDTQEAEKEYLSKKAELESIKLDEPDLEKVQNLEKQIESNRNNPSAIREILGAADIGGMDNPSYISDIENFEEADKKLIALQEQIKALEEGYEENEATLETQKLRKLELEEEQKRIKDKISEIRENNGKEDSNDRTIEDVKKEIKTHSEDVRKEQAIANGRGDFTERSTARKKVNALTKHDGEGDLLNRENTLLHKLQEVGKKIAVFVAGIAKADNLKKTYEEQKKQLKASTDAQGKALEKVNKTTEEFLKKIAEKKQEIVSFQEKQENLKLLEVQEEKCKKTEKEALLNFQNAKGSDVEFENFVVDAILFDKPKDLEKEISDEVNEEVDPIAIRGVAMMKGFLVRNRAHQVVGMVRDIISGGGEFKGTDTEKFSPLTDEEKEAFNKKELNAEERDKLGLTESESAEKDRYKTFYKKSVLKEKEAGIKI